MISNRLFAIAAILVIGLFAAATAALVMSENGSSPASARGASSYTVKCGNYNRGCTATNTIYGQDGDWNFADRAHALEGWMCQKCR